MKRLVAFVVFLCVIALEGIGGQSTDTIDMSRVLDVRVSEFGHGENRIYYFTVSNRSDSVVRLRRLVFGGPDDLVEKLDKHVDIDAKESIRWRDRLRKGIDGKNLKAIEASFKYGRARTSDTSFSGLFADALASSFCDYISDKTIEYIDGKVSRRSLTTSNGSYEEGMMGGAGWCFGSKSSGDFLDGSLSVMAICRSSRCVDITVFNRSPYAQKIDALEIEEGNKRHRYVCDATVSSYSSVTVPILFKIPIHSEVKSIKIIEPRKLSANETCNISLSRREWRSVSETDSNGVIRRLPPEPLDPMSYNLFFPRVDPVPGCIVRCGLMEVLDHTGIYVGNNKIVHRDGDGFLAVVAPAEFLKRLNGANRASHIYVSCDESGKPIGGEEIAKRALLALSDKTLNTGYNVLSNNCHRFCYYCVTGDRESVCPRFVDLQDWTGRMHWRATTFDGVLDAMVPETVSAKNIYADNKFWGTPAESMPFGIIGVGARPLPIMLELLREQESAEINEEQFIDHWSDILTSFLRRLQWRVTPSYGDYYAALGMACYENAMLIPSDKQNYYERAREWWGRGMMVGNAMSCYNLGCLYERGLGGMRERRKAVSCWTRAALLGVSEAKIRLRKSNSNSNSSINEPD